MKRRPESDRGSSPALPLARQHAHSASPNLHPQSASPSSYVLSNPASPNLHPDSTTPNSHVHFNSASPSLHPNSTSPISHSPQGTPSPIQPWLKRWSGLSSSHDNRQTQSRPVSISVSHFDGSAALSSRHSPIPIAPNKLVKRSISLRDPPANSKIPKPTPRKPATSHQRSATLQERRTPRNFNPAHDSSVQSDHRSSPDVRWRSFFTPRVFTEPASSNKRQSHSSIPSPIQRICPDRRYKPVLISATEPVNRASVEYEQEPSQNDAAAFSSSHQQAAPPPDQVASNDAPIALTPGSPRYGDPPSEFDQLKNAGPRSRRSFTFGELFSSEGRKRPTTRTSPDEPGKIRSASAVAQSSAGERNGVKESAQSATVPDSIADVEHSAPENVGAPPDPSSDSQKEVEEALPDTATPPKQDKVSALIHSEFLDLDSAKFGRNSPGRRGPPIDTIFQDSAPAQAHGSHTLLKDILQTGSCQDQGQGIRPRQHSIILEEDDSVTPPRPDRQQLTGLSPAFPPRNSTKPEMRVSPAPDIPSLLQLRYKDKFDHEEDQESSWSFDDADDDNGRSNPTGRSAHLEVPGDCLDPSESATSTPQRQGRPSDRDTRTNIFDWSEQPLLDKSPGNRSPPRPKTVHGKKDADNRASRSVGRRASSGMHTRSQSVPSAPEADGSRVQVVTNKFGTWGVGSKGVTEDWNEDFDFDDLQAALPVLSPGGEKRLDSGLGMVVPQSIREQQTNVLANIGLVRDWGLLIEEIKELKMKAIALDVLAPSNQAVWNEVEAMIDLADQESDEHTLAPRHSPPDSPSSNSDVFDEFLVSARRPSVQGSPLARMRKSESQTASPLLMEQEIRITPATPKRPRKNSEAVARAVIEAVQQNRRSSDSGRTRYEIPEKLHFDTATLRRIIPYVQDLRDRVKGIIREAEGLYASPPKQHYFAAIEKPERAVPESPSAHRNSKRSTPTKEEAMPGEGYNTSEDIAARPRTMTVS